MNIKGIILLVITIISLALNGYSQSTIDFAERNTLIRFKAMANAENKYVLTLNPIIRDTFTTLNEVSFEMIEFAEDNFKVVTKNMLEQLWDGEKKPELINDDDSTLKEDFDKANEQIKNHNLTIDSIKDRIHMMLVQNYDKINLQLDQSKMYKALNNDNGLSQAEQTQYDTYLERLSSIQNQIIMLKKVRNTYYHQDEDDKGGTQDTSSTSDGYESWKGFIPTTPPIPIKNVYEKEKEIEEYITKADGTQVDDLLDKLLLKESVFKYELNRIDNQKSFNVHLIGDANVVSSFRDNSNSSNINAGFGLIANKAGFTEFIGVITVAQAYEDTTSDYGSSILVPGVRRFSLLTRYRTYSIFKYHKHDFMSRIGFAIDVNVTPYKWVKEGSESIKVIPIAINLMLPYTWVHQSKEGQDYAISTDIGLSMRSIAGAATNEDVMRFLNVKSLPWLRTYLGPVIGLNIKYNALRVQFHAPLLISSNENRIQGLTNGQVYASIGIIANLTNDLSKIIKPKE